MQAQQQQKQQKQQQQHSQLQQRRNINEFPRNVLHEVTKKQAGSRPFIGTIIHTYTYMHAHVHTYIYIRTYVLT
jgi:hypothetical protein